MYHATLYYLSQGYGWQRALAKARRLVGRNY